MNLSFSVALRPTSFASLLQTNLAAAVAVCEACAEVCGRPVGGAQGVSIKWPNDVWCEGRKLSGMLLDSTSQQGGEFTAVLGIGINVNQDPMPPEVRAEATSLRLLLPLPRGGGRERPIVSREQLLASILNRLEEMLEWKLDRVLERYAQLELLRDGRRVLVLPRGREDPADSFEAEALGVGPDGCLRIRRADGSIHSLASGDVSIRPT
jgi:BirA family biotin operon repressor/biotin-[acetyl-CoA-carboxylase] ligase